MTAMHALGCHTLSWTGEHEMNLAVAEHSKQAWQAFKPLPKQSPPSASQQIWWLPQGSNPFASCKVQYVREWGKGMGG